MPSKNIISVVVEIPLDFKPSFLHSQMYSDHVVCDTQATEAGLSFVTEN